MTSVRPNQGHLQDSLIILLAFLPSFFLITYTSVYTCDLELFAGNQVRFSSLTCCSDI